jgi:hypothetical protein
MPKKHLQLSFFFSLYLKKKKRELFRGTTFAEEKLGPGRRGGW